MTYHNNFFPNGIEDLPPSGIDAVSRSRITGYTPTEPNVIDTGTEQLESPTVKDIVAQREDNPFLRLGVIGGVMGMICFFLWGIFAFLSPKAPTVVTEEVEVEETVEVEPDYQAQLAFRDQFHSLEKKPQTEPATDKLSTVTKPESLPSAASTSQPEPRLVPQPAAPRTVYRPTSQPTVRPTPQAARITPEPKVAPEQQWSVLANFGSGVSSRSIPQPLVSTQNIPTIPSPQNNTVLVSLSANNAPSSGELGILNRRRIDTRINQSVPEVVIDRSLTKAKIKLPLVWDSSLSVDQQQSSQITVALKEPIYDTKRNIIFDRGSIAIVQIESINDSSGLVTAYVSQIDNTVFSPGELILRNQKKSALVAKGSKTSNFGNQLLAGGVETGAVFGEQMLKSETNSTVSNGTTLVTSQSRNSIGRDLAGSALNGFGSSLSQELENRDSRNRIGNSSRIYTLSENSTVYISNLKPITISP